MPDLDLTNGNYPHHFLDERDGTAGRADNHVIGFIPTMGALHEGHISLIRRARTECSRVYASIFLNPTQFGPDEDLSKYPRTFAADVEKLTAAGVDVLFAPDAKGIYPAEFRTYVTVEGLSDRLEGQSRPGHFRGVATVVLKLFEIVQPHFAFFGRKDAQQVRILQQMTSDLNLNTEIVVCPIVREADGLALSSRNAYLNSEERRAATVLYRSLSEAQTEVNAGIRDALQLKTAIRRILSSESLARVDYAEIVDTGTLEPVVRIDARSVYALLAVHVGKTRLIDNLLIEAAPDSSLRSCL
ncbi:MAG TPA: pantoate--beta-alanine ligase [Pyrinomonadaceae bacterium]|nr:pantoate--beta-alanine ligase [Pyrinomonadaceae bacterium]